MFLFYVISKMKNAFNYMDIGKAGRKSFELPNNHLNWALGFGFHIIRKVEIIRIFPRGRVNFFQLLTVSYCPDYS